MTCARVDGLIPGLMTSIAPVPFASRAYALSLPSPLPMSSFPPSLPFCLPHPFSISSYPSLYLFSLSLFLPLPPSLLFLSLSLPLLSPPLLSPPLPLPPLYFSLSSKSFILPLKSLATPIPLTLPLLPTSLIPSLFSFCLFPSLISFPFSSAFTTLFSLIALLPLSFHREARHKFEYECLT